MREPDYTLTAGPSGTSPAVLRALAAPVTFDYDPVFLEAFADLERKVARLFHTQNDVVVLQGEAILGLEAAARSVVSRGTVCLNLVSGIYGQWFGHWLRSAGADVHEVAVDFDEAIDPDAVRRALDRRPETEVVAVVYTETPAGTTNPVWEIGPIARERGALVIADVISAVVGAPLEVDAWGLDVCVAASQKCLGGPPGLGLVSVSGAAWERMRANADAPRSSYLSLLDWKETWIDGGRERFPHSPSVVDVHGVSAACDEVFAEGLDAVIARHARAARACRAGIRAMGLDLFPRSEAIATNCVTAIRLPRGIDRRQLVGHIREHYGVMLSDMVPRYGAMLPGGGGESLDALVRIGHMGPASRSLTVVLGLSALGRGLCDLGHRVSVGDGVEAALDVLADPVE